MNLFLDSSVVLAACGRRGGASRAVFDYCQRAGWTLLTCPYVLGEVRANLNRLGPQALHDWNGLQARLAHVPDVYVFDRPVVFAAAKDRPVLFSAAATADVLLTLDRSDFGALMGAGFYGLTIMKPGAFLERERAAEGL